jgi:prevent-host-death family protein
MREIGAFEAKNRLGTLLDWVEGGEEVVITRHGRPVARLVPHADGASTARAQASLAELRALRSGTRLEGVSLRELIDEGRR